MLTLLLQDGLLQKLKQFYTSCLVVEPEKQRLMINLSHSSDGVDLTEIWKASEVLGTTEAALENITGIYLPAAFEGISVFSLLHREGRVASRRYRA